MKKLIIFITTLFTASATLTAQDISGQWNGILKAPGAQLTIVLNVTKIDNGYTATMDSPDQGVKGISVTTISYEDAVLKFAIPAGSVSYEGTLNKDQTITGNFTQQGYAMPLNFSREKVVKVMAKRPQNPTKPYPYHAEDVVFNNEEANIKLAGTLTYPKKEGTFPAVILISGSGPQNRNSEVADHQPFLVLANHLTKQGIAVLRFDDRGTAESEGNFADAVPADFVTDVNAAITYLQSRKEINKQQIGLIGHSEGGMVAPMVASENKDVSYIVLLAAPGVLGADLLATQQKAVYLSAGVAENIADEIVAINRKGSDIIVKAPVIDNLKPQLTSYFTQALEGKETLLAAMGTTKGGYTNAIVSQMNTPGMQGFIKNNPKPYLSKTNCPVLVLNGGKDIQVDAAENVGAITYQLASIANPSVTNKIYPKLNHLFQECNTCTIQEYETIEQTFAPYALEDISNWILKTIE